MKWHTKQFLPIVECRIYIFENVAISLGVTFSFRIYYICLNNNNNNDHIRSADSSHYTILYRLSYAICEWICIFLFNGTWWWLLLLWTFTLLISIYIEAKQSHVKKIQKKVEMAKGKDNQFFSFLFSLARPEKELLWIL